MQSDTTTDQKESDTTDQKDTEQTCVSCEPQLPANVKSSSVNSRYTLRASATSDIPIQATRKTRTRNVVLPVRYRDQPGTDD